MTSYKVESDEHRRTPPNRGVLHCPLVPLLPFSLHPDSNTPISHPHYRSHSQPRLLQNPNHLHPTTLPSPLRPTLPTRISMSDDRCGTSNLGTFPVQLFERQRLYCPKNLRRDLISMMQIGIPPWMGGGSCRVGFVGRVGAGRDGKPRGRGRRLDITRQKMVLGFAFDQPGVTRKI